VRGLAIRSHRSLGFLAVVVHFCRRIEGSKSVQVSEVIFMVFMQPAITPKDLESIWRFNRISYCFKTSILQFLYYWLITNEFNLSTANVCNHVIQYQFMLPTRLLLLTAIWKGAIGMIIRSS
jgi:hypothetical protein